MNLISPLLPPVDHSPNLCYLKDSRALVPENLAFVLEHRSHLIPFLSIHRFPPFHPLFGPSNNRLNTSTHSELTPPQKACSTCALVRSLENMSFYLARCFLLSPLFLGPYSPLCKENKCQIPPLGSD